MRIKQRDPVTGEISDDFTEPVIDLPLDLAKAKKIDELNTACNETILSTFSSSCLGESHTYSFSYDAQMNLSGILGAVNAGIAPVTITWKTEDAGTFSHTVAQFKQLFADGMVFKQTNIYRYRSLKDQVNACATKADIDLIVW